MRSRTPVDRPDSPQKPSYDVEVRRRLSRHPALWTLHETASALVYLARWIALVVPLGVLVGSLVALFLWLLDAATRLRWENPWLLWWLPTGGLVVGAIYHWLGRAVEDGSNLIVDEIHAPGGGVPGRMAPLVLFGTIATHLFGGSAGREGTAVQIGGAVAGFAAKRFELEDVDVQILLAAGIACGFAAVFGTVVAGAVFALEVLTIGRVNYRGLIPCLAAAIVGNATVDAWHIHHTSYHVAVVGAQSMEQAALLLVKVMVAAVLFGLASVLFSELTHAVSSFSRKITGVPMLRPFIGGVVVIVFVLVLGTRDYLGLGVTSPDPNAVTILSAFHTGGATHLSWWWKTVFTAVTLGFGLKGGEVTPLFFVGATLGNTLAYFSNAPPDLFAAIGFVAVFAGATNTPLACTIMGIELFGADSAVYLAVGCFIAYLCSGHSGIYSSQRIGTPKFDGLTATETRLTLGALHSLRSKANLPDETRP